MIAEDAYHEHAQQLKDLLDKETFFRELPAIDQHTKALEEEYQRRFSETLTMRTTNYGHALDELKRTPGWEQLDSSQQEAVAEPLKVYANATNEESAENPKLRADSDACAERMRKAVEKMMIVLDGQRIAQVSASAFFKGGIESEEQLDAALNGLREECERLIGAGKKVLVQ